MSCLRAGFSVNGSSGLVVKNRDQGSLICSSLQTLQFKESNPTDFWRRTIHVLDQKPVRNFNSEAPEFDPRNMVGNVTSTNMIDIQSAQQLVDSLLNAGDRLVVLHFYSPSCGGCKTLHPKICQVAEVHPNTIFLNANYDQHQAMCRVLKVHALPFFRFYRGAEGRACSFSCTNATIKKFKDALAKHGVDSCRPGPAKGLDESELLALASMGLISRNLEPNSDKDDPVEDFVLGDTAMVMS